MDPTRIVVPDLGETPDVEVVEILVSPGDRVGLDEPVIVLESDKSFELHNRVIAWCI